MPISMTSIPRASRLLRAHALPSLFPFPAVPRVARLRMLSTAAGTSSSVRDSEIEHFSRLSSEWWNEKGEFGLLHTMNPSRVQFIREKMQEVAQFEDSLRASQQGCQGSDAPMPARFLEGKDVIDVGCGGGLLTESLARLGARTLGVDATASNIAIASEHASRDPGLTSGLSALRYVHGTAEAVLARGEQFDIVTSMEVVEHVADPESFARTLAALAKPGGHIFMSTIAKTPLSWFLTILMAENVLGLATPGTHHWSQYVDPDQLTGFFTKGLGWHNNGQSIVPGAPRVQLPARLQHETRGLVYVPWKNTWDLASRGCSMAEQCNYIFWIRKPQDA